MLEAYQNRVIALLENGCEDVDILSEAFTSLVQHHEQHAPSAAPPSILQGVGADGASDSAERLSNSGAVVAEERCPGVAELQAAATPQFMEQPLEFASARTKSMTPLEVCVLTQNNVAMELLLKHGAHTDNVSGLSCSALCKVCYMFPWNMSMMRMLLEHGANPDATTNNDTSSASCLIISVVKDNLDAVKLLLEFGADVSYEWKGQNALSMALDMKKLDVAAALEKHEFRRAQDNRWRRFTDRKKIEESREQQRHAIMVQRQLETDRQRMLHREHVPSDLPRPSEHELQSSAARRDIEGGAGELAHPTSASQQSVHARPQPSGGNGSVNVLRIEEVSTPGAAPMHGSSRVGSAGMPAESEGAGGGASRAGDVVRDMASMDWIVSLSDIQVMRPISSGAHGEVFEAVLLSSDERVALKWFPCNDDKSRACFRQECMMLSRFRHENIVMFKGAVISESMCAILSELCAENLMDRVQRLPILRWGERLRIARDIARAMTYLHSRTPPIVHRDLKSLNVLLDAQGIVKLCDFGMARTREHTYIATQHIAGSPAWMAPEVLRGDDFNDQSDVYAFGVILWELMTLKVPWPDKNMAQLVGLVGFAGARLELPDVEGCLEGSRADPQQQQLLLPAAGGSGDAQRPTRPGGGSIPLPPGCPLGYVALMRACWEASGDRPSFKTVKSLLDGMLSDID